MTKKIKAYPLVLTAKLTIDVAAIAPKMIDEHDSLIASGYKLRSPVVVNMRRDGTMTVPFVYRDSCSVQTWRVEAYAGWMFGRGPAYEDTEVVP